MSGRSPAPGADHAPTGSSSRTCVLFFSTPGCAACQSVRSHIARLGAGDGAPIIAIEGDPAIASRFRVRTAPTLIALHDGVEVARRGGAQTAESIAELLRAAASGSSTGRGVEPTGLIGLRAAAATAVLVGGLVLSAPVVTTVGAGLAAWALASIARKLHDLRAR